MKLTTIRPISDPPSYITIDGRNSTAIGSSQWALIQEFARKMQKELQITVGISNFHVNGSLP